MMMSGFLGYNIFFGSVPDGDTHQTPWHTNTITHNCGQAPIDGIYSLQHLSDVAWGSYLTFGAKMSQAIIVVFGSIFQSIACVW